MQLLTIFISSFIIALSGALMPGPLLTITISESTRRGFVAGPLIILGHGILEATLVVALMMGLAPYLSKDYFFISIALAGGLILFWMAISMFKSLPHLSLQLKSNKTRRHNLILTGIIFSLANPYWSIWWASIGLGYILHSMEIGLLGVCVFFAGHILADLGWYALISYFTSNGCKYFSDRTYRGLIACCAAFLICFSLYFFYSGVERFISYT